MACQCGHEEQPSPHMGLSHNTPIHPYNAGQWQGTPTPSVALPCETPNTSIRPALFLSQLPGFFSLLPAAVDHSLRPGAWLAPRYLPEGLCHHEETAPAGFENCVFHLSSGMTELWRLP